MRLFLAFFLCCFVVGAAGHTLAQSPVITNVTSTSESIRVEWTGGPGTYTASSTSNNVNWITQIETAGVREVSLPLSGSIQFLRLEHVPVEETVEYGLTFTATWSESTHPTNFPSNPHFSPLIGATHNDQASFWEPGTLASTGTSQVAETGRTTTFNQELQAAITAGHALATLGSGGLSSPGNRSFTFTADRDYPLLTIITMIAPSPDWFVGLHGYDLIQGDTWIDNVAIPLFVYDAGTDSGTTYRSPNQDTQPAELVERRNDIHFAPGGTLTAVGSIELQKVQ